jgi:hypothetical protein
VPLLPKVPLGSRVLVAPNVRFLEGKMGPEGQDWVQGVWKRVDLIG